jgi:hypothetical protein
MPTVKTYKLRVRSETDIGELHVEAHQATIEPSGALSFWHISPDLQVSTLMFAFSKAEWLRLELDIPERPKCPVRMASDSAPCGQPVFENLAVCYEHAKP